LPDSKVKEELYLYLLQKEESALSVTESNARVVDVKKANIP
jgi:hypothetical protein